MTVLSIVSTDDDVVVTFLLVDSWLEYLALVRVDVDSEKLGKLVEVELDIHKDDLGIVEQLPLGQDAMVISVVDFSCSYIVDVVMIDEIELVLGVST